MKVYPVLKRCFDFVLACILLILLLIPFIIVGIIIKLESHGPVIFKQKRYGKDEQVFEIYKFRTMAKDTPELPTRLFDDSLRHITKTGRIFRKTSIDELPQLLNILKGEMSFIGPRPVILKETELTEKRKQYGADKCYPGITGWAQVYGRDHVEIEEKARLDAYYAKNISCWLDIKILFLTVIKVFRGKDIKEGSGEKNSNIDS